MVQSPMVRAVLGTLRLPSTRSVKPTVQRVSPWWAARRWMGVGPLPTTGGDRDRDRDRDGDRDRDRDGNSNSDVGGRRDGPARLLWNPLLLDPLPLLVPIPLNMAVPVQQASNGYGAVFFLEATCECSFELYKPLLKASVLDAVVATVHEAASMEMSAGGWSHSNWSQGWQKEQFAAQVMARMASSAAGPQRDIKIQFSKYKITDVRFEPLHTLAAIANQTEDHRMALIAASFLDIARHVTMDGPRLRATIEEKVAVAAKGATTFVKLCNCAQPAPPPKDRRWMLVLLSFVLALAVVLPTYLAIYAVLCPDIWSAKKDEWIEAYAKSFKRKSSWGILGESLEQRRDRLIYEEQRRLEQEQLKMRQEEDRRKKQEEKDAALRFEARMTSWEWFLYRNNVGDRRFQRFRRP